MQCVYAGLEIGTLMLISLSLAFNNAQFYFIFLINGLLTLTLHGNSAYPWPTCDSWTCSHFLYVIYNQLGEFDFIMISQHGQILYS